MYQYAEKQRKTNQYIPVSSKQIQFAKYNSLGYTFFV